MGCIDMQAWPRNLTPIIKAYYGFKVAQAKPRAKEEEKGDAMLGGLQSPVCLVHVSCQLMVLAVAS